jgi:predicted nucleic acid-binding protein
LIVADASAVLELVLGTARAERLGARALTAGETLHAPHLIDVEVAQALRRLVQLKQVTAARAEQALDDFGGIKLERYPHADLLPRIWELRESVTAYDACYLALAEALEAPLLTCDARLARAHGHCAKIELIGWRPGFPGTRRIPIDPSQGKRRSEPYSRRSAGRAAMA